MIPAASASSGRACAVIGGREICASEAFIGNDSGLVPTLRNAGIVPLPRPLRRTEAHAACHQTLPQWEHMPVISMTGAFGMKPARFAAAASVLVTSADGVSPTAPHRSQIRNTTGVPVA